MMGNKIRAKETMKEAGFRSCPAATAWCTTSASWSGWRERIGFPVILKAAAGGGGRGMKIAREKEQLSPMYRTASRRRWRRSERRHVHRAYVERPRHIEIQIVATSTQRHPSRRTRMLGAAAAPEDAGGESLAGAERKAARADGPHRGRAMRRSVQQRGDHRVPARRARRFYFMEMNTRIQVEHPSPRA